jgi:hypothetical protein
VVSQLNARTPKAKKISHHYPTLLGNRHRSLLKNLRYAILIIFIVAAVVTPTPDVQTMMVFAMPMLSLYLLGNCVGVDIQKEVKGAHSSIAAEAGQLKRGIDFERSRMV